MKVYAKIKTSQLIVKKMPYSDILNNFEAQDKKFNQYTYTNDRTTWAVGSGIIKSYHRSSEPWEQYRDSTGEFRGIVTIEFE